MYDYFRVTGARYTVLDSADLFSVILHDDNVQEFDARWGGQGDGMSPTGGEGLARVPNLRVCKHLLPLGEVAQAGGEGRK